MRRFCLKTIVFMLVLVVLICGILWIPSTNDMLNQAFAFLTCSQDYERQSAEIQVLKDVQGINNDYDKIMVGDSVCYMLFTRLQDVNDKYFLGGNTRPCTMATQYVLVKEFIDAHPDAKEVYIFLSKDSWESTIDIQCGYSYVVVPHTQAKTIDDLDQDTRDDMRNKFGSFLMNPVVVNAFDRSQTNRKLVLNGLSEWYDKVLGQDMSSQYVLTENQISPLSQKYFLKIVQLCAENNIQLHLLHDPVADTPEKHQEIEVEKQMFEDAGLYDQFPEYFLSVLYYPPEYFFDGIHFIVDDELDNQVINDIRRHTGLLQDFVVP